MGLQVFDAPYLFRSVIGGMHQADIVKFDKVKEYFRGILVLKVKSSIANTIITDKISALEISANGLAYVLQNGSIYIIDPSTGTILLVNSDFQGAGASWIFSSSGKLYMCGAYGPDLYVLNSDGTTLCRINSISNQYGQPYSMYFTTGNNIVITYGMSSYGGEGTYPIEFDVTKYFGTIQNY